jgi:hypothetical protein
MVASPKGSDPRKTALARVSSIYKRQIRPLVREAGPQKQDRNCQTVIIIWLWAPRLTDWLTDWLSAALWLWQEFRESCKGVLWREDLGRPHTNCVKTRIKTWDKRDKSWRQHHDSDRCEAVFIISFVSTVLLSLCHVADIVSWLLHVLTHAGVRPTLVCTAVICEVWKLAEVLQLLVVTICKWSINPVQNPSVWQHARRHAYGAIYGKYTYTYTLPKVR